MSNTKIIADKQDFIAVASYLRSKIDNPRSLSFPEGFKEAVDEAIYKVSIESGGSSETPSTPTSSEFLIPIKLNKASYQTFSLSLIETDINVNDVVE